MGVGAGDHDFARLDGLAQGFQNGAGKFGKFVKEQNAVMGQRNLARFSVATTAHDSGHGCRVMRFAEGARAADAAVVQQSGQRMDHRCFQRLDR